MVPSAVHLLEQPGPPRPHRQLAAGRAAHVPRPARPHRPAGAGAQPRSVQPRFVPTFKPALSSEAMRPLAASGGARSRAREVARAFLRELLAEVKRATGERIRDLVVTVAGRRPSRPTAPSCSASCSGLGVRRVRFVDEPVAAALGYGLSLAQERTVLVVDIGGGTMHVVLVRLSPRGALAGEARVLAKQGGRSAATPSTAGCSRRSAGWPATRRSTRTATSRRRFWRRLMLAEACRVKEAVFFEETAVFRDHAARASASAGASQAPSLPDLHARAARGAARERTASTTASRPRSPPSSSDGKAARRGRGRRRAAGRRLDAAARRLRRCSRGASSGAGCAPGSRSRRWPTAPPASPPTASARSTSSSTTTPS